MVHGKDLSARAKRVVLAFKAATESKSVAIPLSAIHYMETSRISNVGRKTRLGTVMWNFSKGATIAPYPLLVRHELELALSKHFPQVQVGEFSLVGRGSSHAFGIPRPQGLLAVFEEEVERSLLVGNSKLQIDPPSFRNSKHQENFKNHLSSLHAKSKELPKEMWDNWLHAILFADIIKPLSEVATRHGIPKSVFESLGEVQLKAIVNDMPTRRLDLHLHKQVLRNPGYLSKITDLEDWTGVGAASCYFDVVVCENHMVDMLKRNGFETKARVETNLENTFVLVKSA
jgi:hypothetical protein